MKTRKGLKSVFLAVIMFGALISVSKAQEESSKAELSVGADIVSNYIWRGIPNAAYFGFSGDGLSLSPNIQPDLSLKCGDLTVGVWGSYDFLGAYQETDLYISYEVGPLTFSLTDYYWNYPASYFKYKASTTTHIFEGAVSYSGSESFPISITAATMFYGADKKFDKDKGAFTTDNNYSTYVELSYPVKLGSSEISPFMGFTTGDGFYGDGYGNVDGFAVVNLGCSASKDIEVTEKLTIPMTASLVLNPQLERVFFVVGISL